MAAAALAPILTISGAVNAESALVAAAALNAVCSIVGQWVPTAPLHIQVLVDGRLYAIGGVDGSMLIEVLDDGRRFVVIGRDGRQTVHVLLDGRLFALEG